MTGLYRNSAAAPVEIRPFFQIRLRSKFWAKFPDSAEFLENAVICKRVWVDISEVQFKTD